MYKVVMTFYVHTALYTSGTPQFPLLRRTCLSQAPLDMDTQFARVLTFNETFKITLLCRSS